MIIALQLLWSIRRPWTRPLCGTSTMVQQGTMERSMPSPFQTVLGKECNRPSQSRQNGHDVKASHMTSKQNVFISGRYSSRFWPIHSLLHRYIPLRQSLNISLCILEWEWSWAHVGHTAASKWSVLTSTEAYGCCPCKWLPCRNKGDPSTYHLWITTTVSWIPQDATAIVLWQARPFRDFHL